MLIQITQAVRLGVLDREVQAFEPGEIYGVAPSIGHVLVAEGWAREVTIELDDAGATDTEPMLRSNGRLQLRDSDGQLRMR